MILLYFIFIADKYIGFSKALILLIQWWFTYQVFHMWQNVIVGEESGPCTECTYIMGRPGHAGVAGAEGQQGRKGKKKMQVIFKYH